MNRKNNNKKVYFKQYSYMYYFLSGGNYTVGTVTGTEVWRCS